MEMTDHERIPLELTREQVDWLLAKTEKHLKVYEERLGVMELLEKPGHRLRMARYDVQQATAIAAQLRAQDAGEGD